MYDFILYKIELREVDNPGVQQKSVDTELYNIEDQLLTAHGSRLCIGLRKKILDKGPYTER